MDKTQVYSYKNNDHLTKRMLHVLFVSKIARTISRALRLNEEFYVTVVNGGNKLYERICKLDELYEVMDEFVYTIKSIAFKIGVTEFMEYWRNYSAVDNL